MGHRAEISSGRSFYSSGRWAGERFIAAAAQGQDMTPALLRGAETVLRRDEWKEFDNVLVRNAQLRLRAVADLKALGLTRSIPNAMGTTILEWERMGDMQEADVSLDGVTRSENDRVEFSFEGLPIPIIHKDWYLNLRHLAASRKNGTPLDSTYNAEAGRKIAEKSEDLLVNGYPGKFGGLSIYGYTTHPDRNITAFGTGGSWSQVAKTGEQILTDIQTMISLANADGFYGPFVIYIDPTASIKLSGDFKTNSDKSIRSRMAEVDSVSDIRTLDTLDANEVLMVQMSPDVVTLLEGEPLQNIQWDVNGGMQINFKAFMIEVPLIRSTADGKSGIVHMS